MQGGIFRLRRVLVAGLGVVALVTGLSVPAGAVSGVITVAAAGQFDGLAAGSVVAGVASPAGAQQFNYTFTATCGGAACPATGDTYTWNFGDGASVTSTSSVTSTHAYASTGVYSASLSVSSSTGYGSGSVTVLVSPRFSDADASTNTAGDASPSDRAAIWTVAAYGIMGSCRTTTNGVSTISQIRPAFCPSPTALSGVPSLVESLNENGVTGESCFATATGLGSGDVPAPYENCDLNPAAFLQADPSNGDVAGDPLNQCGPVCQATLESDGELNSSGDLVVSALNCGDGYVAQQEGTYYQAVSGVEPGCVSRGAFFAALIGALDDNPSVEGTTETFTSAQLSAAAATCPGDSASLSSSPYATAVERAHFLGLTTTWRGTTSCDLSAPITKGEAYQLLATVTGTPAASACSGYRDLVDETLGAGTTTPNPQCTSDLALVAAGVPVVDSTSCVTGGGTCFNPDDPLSRGGLATLLADLVNGLPNPTNTAYSPTSWTASVDTASLYNGAVIQSTPNAYYELNDQVSGAFDSSGNNAYGLYEGTYAQSATGPLAGTTAGSVSLHGSGYVAIPSPYGTSATTTALWFTTTGNGPLIAGQNSVVGSSTPGHATVYLAVAGGKLVSGVSSVGTGLSTGPSSYDNVNDGTWHQVVYVVGSGGGLSLYLDGNLISHSSANDTWTSTTSAELGAGYSGGAWSYFTGSIADVATWSSALSASQISALYATSAATNEWSAYNTLETGSGTLGYWPLSGANVTGCTASAGANGTSCDASGHGNNLTWTSSSATSCGVAGGTSNVAQTASGPTNFGPSQEIANGSKGCVGVSANSLGSLTQVTVTAWVNLESTPAGSGYVADVVTTNGTQALTLSIDSSCKSYASGSISFTLEGSNWLSCVSASTALSSTHTWYELTANWTGSSGSAVAPSQMTLWLNHTQLTTTSLSVGTAANAPLSSLGNVVVGGNPSDSTANLFTQSSDQGALADVSVSTAAFATTEPWYAYCAAIDNQNSDTCT